MLDRSAILRLLVSLIADELALSGKPLASPHTLTEASCIGTPPASGTPTAPHIPVDSIDLLAVATRISSFFHIFESGIDDALLMHRTLGDWIDIVLQSQADADSTGNLTFRTSGSSGQPKLITHTRQNILDEARSLQLLLAAVHPSAPSARIVSVVPPHHLYGFMWTVALAHISGLPVFTAAPAGMARAKILKPGDILIAYPAWYTTIGSLIPSLGGIIAVSSAGPLPEATAAELRSKRAVAVLDIYGSTETGGIAARWFPNPCHELLAHWQRGDDGQSLTRGGDAAGPDLPDASQLAFPDHINWRDDRKFTVGPRLDGAVKIAGTNVFPAHIAEVLTSHPKVRQCIVRASTLADYCHPAETLRLKAFIVPEDGTILEEHAALDDLRRELDEFTCAQLSTPQRPTRIDFGATLPSGPMGKSADW